jgi:hypothetical protein
MISVISHGRSKHCSTRPGVPVSDAGRIAVYLIVIVFSLS